MHWLSTAKRAEDIMVKRRRTRQSEVLKYLNVLMGLQECELVRQCASINSFAGALMVNITCLFYPRLSHDRIECIIQMKPLNLGFQDQLVAFTSDAIL